MLVRFSGLVVRHLPPRAVLPRCNSVALAPLQHALSTDARTKRKGPSYASLAGLAAGGVVAGVAVQQLLFPSPPASPQQDPPIRTPPPKPQQLHEPATSTAASGPHAATTTSSATSPPSSGGSVSDPVIQALEEEQRRSQQKTASPQPASTGLPGPWSTDEEFQLVLHRRAVTKNRLMAYIASMQQRMHQIAAEAQMMGKRGEAWFQERMKEMEEVVDLQAQIIIFGVDEPHARRRHLEKYGCSKWTDEALDIIKKYSPLVEIGAGHGHWQKALADKGADVVAFDNETSLPMEGMPNVGVVQKGDEKEIRKHRNRTLLLIYPGPEDMAMNCLKEYKGTHLIYVGEKRGGVNGTDEFFDKLQAEWEVQQVAPLDPFPDGYEQLYVLKRKGKAGKGWWR